MPWVCLWALTVAQKRTVRAPRTDRATRLSRLTVSEDRKKRTHTRPAAQRIAAQRCKRGVLEKKKRLTNAGARIGTADGSRNDMGSSRLSLSLKSYPFLAPRAISL